ncbi:apoptosis-inducing factor, partial [Fusarium langsethiae]
MLRKTVLWVQIFASVLAMMAVEVRRRARSMQTRLSGTAKASGPDKNIVIVGASFAGWWAIQTLANYLPHGSGYQIVAGEEIPYEYLVVATGSEVEEGLPSRVNHTEKGEGVRRLREMQAAVKAAKSIVVVGGGAAGVEVATDAKDLYPEKKVTIVHSRDALMHRFGKDLQEEALKWMKQLEVDVILGERVVAEDANAGTVTLRSGTVLECDKFINCTGQKPASGILKGLSPRDGHLTNGNRIDRFIRCQV